MVTPRKTEQIRQASYPARRFRAQHQPALSKPGIGSAGEKYAPGLYSCRLSFAIPTADFPCPKLARFSLPAHCPTPTVRSTSAIRSEEHTSELQSLMRNSYAFFCFKKKKIPQSLLFLKLINLSFIFYMFSNFITF